MTRRRRKRKGPGWPLSRRRLVVAPGGAPPMVPSAWLGQVLAAENIDEARAIAKTFMPQPRVHREEQDMSDDYPMVLVDQPDDGCIEDQGWVEVTSQTNTVNKAIEFLAKDYPPDEHVRYEGRTGVMVNLRPCANEIEMGVFWVEEEGDCHACHGSARVTVKDGPEQEECDDCHGTGSKGYGLEYMPWEKCVVGAEGAVSFWEIDVEEAIHSEAAES